MKIGLLDNNNENLQRIKDIFETCISGCSVSCFTTPFSFVTYIYDVVKGDIDLLFIHVLKENDDNIFLAKDIQSFFPHIRIIFYSEDTVCAENIFTANPSYFLKIPFKLTKIKHAISKINDDLDEECNQVITILEKGKTQRIKLSSILYMESVGRKMYVYTNERVCVTNMTMNDIMEKIPSYFFQCHRSYVVNLDRVSTMMTDELTMLNGQSIPIARSRQKELKKIMENINRS